MDRRESHLFFVTWLCVCIGYDHLSSSCSPWSFFFLVALVICTWDNLGLSQSCICWRIIFNGIYSFGPGCSPWSSVSFILSWIILVNIDCFFGGFNLLGGTQNWTSNLHGFSVVMAFCGLFLHGFRNSLNLVRIQGLFLADNLSASCLGFSKVCEIFSWSHDRRRHRDFDSAVLRNFLAASTADALVTNWAPSDKDGLLRLLLCDNDSWVDNFFKTYLCNCLTFLSWLRLFCLLTRLVVILSSGLSRSAAVAGRGTETESVWCPEVWREKRGAAREGSRAGLSCVSQCHCRKGLNDVKEQRKERN